MSIREKALDSWKQHQSSWIKLAMNLETIKYGNDYKEWGHEKFSDYCTNELSLSMPNVNQMLQALIHIKETHPSALNAIEKGEPNNIPHFSTINTIVKARKKSEDGEEREKIDKLEEEIFSGEPETALKEVKEMKKSKGEQTGEEIMLDIKVKTKKAQNAVKRAIKQVCETSSFGNDVIEQAEKLEKMVTAVNVNEL